MVEHDKAVSEIIGTMLVFGMLVSSVSAFELWYVPTVESSYEKQFQSQTEQALSSLLSQMENQGIKNGQIVSQNIPLGIAGTLFTPSESTNINFENGGFNATMSYQLGINYKLLENTVPSAISNKVVGTFPSINGKIPIDLVQIPGKSIVYMTEYSSNSIVEINTSSMKIVGSYYAGVEPFGIAYDPSGYLYISDSYRFYSSTTGNNYSTITVFSIITNTIVDTINADGSNPNLLYPTGLAYVSAGPASNYGYVYVSDYYNNQGQYIPSYSVINTSNNAVISNAELSNTFPLNSQFYENTPYESAVLNFVVQSSTNYYDYVWISHYFQDNITILNITNSFLNPPITSIGSVHSDLKNPYAMTYDTQSKHVYVTDFNYTIGNKKTPPHHHSNKGHHYGQKKKYGNITEFDFNGIYKNTIKIPISMPAGIAYDPYNNTIYVSNYNETYNLSSSFFYSQIIAINASNNKQSNYSSYDQNGKDGFLLGPDSMIVSDSSNELIVADNESNNVAFINLSGPPKASYVWDNYLNTPVSLAYDYGSGFLAVVNQLSDNVVLFNGSTNNVARTVNVGIAPDSIAFNPANGYFYVTNNGSNNVTVFNPVTGEMVANIPLTHDRPSFVLYDSINQSIYALNNNTSSAYQVVQINSQNIVAHSITLTGLQGPVSAAIDGYKNWLMVVGEGTNNLLIVNLTNGNVVKDISVGDQPDSVVYDSLDNLTYVSNYLSKNVTIISMTSNSAKIVGSIGLGSGQHPASLLMDDGNGYLYISEAIRNNVTLYNTFTGKVVNNIATGKFPYSMFYNNRTGIISVANELSNQVTEINGGTLYFNGKPGENGGNVYKGSGQLVDYGNTPFITPVTYYMQDNLVLTNYSSTKYVTSSANVPISITNVSGKLFLSSYLLDISGPSSSVSGIGSNSLKLEMSNIALEHYYMGEPFTYYDLYGNPYPALITGVYLLNFTYVINSPYVNEINQLLYNNFYPSLSGFSAPMSWQMAKYPFHVNVNNETITVSSFTGVVEKIYSANFEYAQAYMLEV